MSLINDALKRAKQAQEKTQTPAESGPQFRPVEPGQMEAPRRNLAVPVGFAVLGMMVIVLLIQLKHATGVGKPVMTVAAAQKTTPPAPPPIPTGQPDSTASPEKQPVRVPESSAVALTAPAKPEAPVPVTEPPVAKPEPAPEPSEPATQTSDTSAAAPAPLTPPVQVTTPAPKPGVIKLQGIVYHPKRPSAMINGRTVWVGDKVGEFRVAEIDRTGVTLTDGKQPHRLLLSR